MKKKKDMKKPLLAAVLACSMVQIPAIPVAAAAPENLALNQTVTASSYEQPTNNPEKTSPSKAVDGDLTTRWGTAQNLAANEWINVNLGSSKQIQQININFERTDDAQNILGYKVEIANGNDTYTEIYRKEAAATEKRQQFQKLIREELVRYYFQPIISGKTGETIAYEALMRVSLPMITNPGQVMELAREEGCLHEIERITMFKSAESYLFLEREGLISGKEKLFVNSVASQHMTEAESKEYARRFTSLQSRLVVEITEEEGMDSSALEIKRNTLGLQGNFALDDYGSGYSNEKNLIDLSPAYIKVDISIIRDIDKSQDKQQIVSNIVSYAHGRNMQIVAEGMETAAELETVLALGVDLLQGYFLARPAPVPSKISDEALAVIQAFEAKQTASS